MILFLLGCVSFHDIGRLKDFSSQKERVAHAQQAAKLSSRPYHFRESQKQAFAIQVVGQLRVTEPDIISALLDRTNSSSSAVRKQTYWSLGELGRELDWNEDSQAIHAILLQKLFQNPSDIESQLIIEAIIKNYVQHSHTTDEDVHTLKEIHSFLAKTPNPPSPIFVLKQQLQTLPVLVAVLKEQVNDHNELDIYTSSLELMRFLYTNQTQIYNAHNKYKNSLSEAFSLTTKILEEPSPSQSMILWFLSVVANRPPLSSYVAGELVLLEENLSPANRFLLQEAVFQMIEEESSRQYFRNNFLQNQSNFIWWHENEATSLDLVQQIYGIKVESK